MSIKIIKSSKEELEAEIENLTLIELLKVYLNKDPAVTFAAWKRTHYTKTPILAIKTKGKTAKKAMNDAISSATKDLDKTFKEFKGKA